MKHAQVRLAVGEENQATTFEVISDPRVDTAQADLEMQRDLLLQIRDKISAAHASILQLRDVREQAQGWHKRLAAHQEVVGAVDALLEKLATIERELIMPGEQTDTFGLNVPFGLNARLASVISVAGSADRAPTKQAQEIAAEYGAEIDEQLATLQMVMDGDVAELNELIAGLGVAAVVV